ncbi:hypothetical protein AZL_d02830 (plasmid) [Azospirillum sp. B510]|uniref:hypothetical protein n=1 Tax=Azospirillum sp. (strain B510) TaxID=137722 RepID=UPI0001C4C809|nr:hypothetical protein [Azospirillum sp. B510]BAI76109.1 hypothetical protein AZL_d02830 [Azospirillum sp. B510]
MTRTKKPPPSTALPSPLNLTIEQILNAGATIVPLFIVPFDKTNPYARKVGIPVIVTPDAPTHGTQLPEPVLFEFDTGGKAFWADSAKLPSLAGCTTHGEVFTQYTSGITYFGQATDVYVSLIAGAGPGPVTTKATIAAVDTILRPKDQQEGPSTFPIFNYFSGDFGVSLQSTASAPQSPLKHQLPSGYSPPSSMPEMLGVLSQLSYNNGAGFIVDLVNTVPYIGEELPKGTLVGRLILGGIETLATSFPLAYAMQSAGTSYTQLFGDETKIATYAEGIATGTAYVQVPDTPYASAPDISYVMDTGATETTFYQGTNLNVSMRPAVGDSIVLNLDGGQTVMKFTAGSEQCNDLTAWGKGDRGNGCVNTGLGMFLQFPVLYDLANGKLCLPAPPN